MLRDYLTINVSSFFRDPEKFNYLRDNIFPELLDVQTPLKVWSAGCSYGQEPYSIAMILSEIAGIAHPHRVLATDLDQSAVEHAHAGGPYSAEDVATIPDSLSTRYVSSATDGYHVVDEVRRQVTFKAHNLLEDPCEHGFDLIVCRNVVIYFTTEVKDRLYRTFCECLRPGGVLFVGGTEIISRSSDFGFETAGISFYRRCQG